MFKIANFLSTIINFIMLIFSEINTDFFLSLKFFTILNFLKKFGLLCGPILSRRNRNLYNESKN